MSLHNAQVRITLNDWRHFITFSLSNCLKSTPEHQIELQSKPNRETQYIMNVYSRYFNDPHKFNHKSLTGFANHFLYHRCALGISHYELDIQPEQLQAFLKNPVLKVAAEQGYLTFILKNPVSSSRILTFN